MRGTGIALGTVYVQESRTRSLFVDKLALPWHVDQHSRFAGTEARRGRLLLLCTLEQRLAIWPWAIGSIEAVFHRLKLNWRPCMSDLSQS
jgi:hypothetical protein